ncbi:MAG: hypothetical protein B7X06_02965 [Verrucomicrobia bacterium 21-51-4]|nr:MAG: hypothetical protein B7X06_02965 [Verrucomicrobia bacterium 21-51-4]
MVTEETKTEAEKSSDQCVFRMLDRILVKGRTHPVAVYEVAGFKEDMTQLSYDCIDYYQKALECYFHQDWLGGLRWLAKSTALEALQPGAMPSIYTNPSLVLVERCNYFRKHGAGLNWDGVFVMAEK